MSKSSYVLESPEETERLERQSTFDAYNYRNELSGFFPKKNGNILDAGCGSGIVARHLAQSYPDAQVVGCDFSEIRIAQATSLAHGISNLHFQKENLTQLSFETASFDGINCRYVLEHLSDLDVPKVLSELYRCIRPNGILCAIDIDGLLYNVFPKTEFMHSVLSKIAVVKSVNFNIGRQIPNLLSQAGFSNVSWKIEPMQFQGPNLEVEIQLMKERFDLAMPFLTSITGGEEDSRRFIEEYFECLQAPNAVLFYNKFIVHAEKTGFKRK